jgi:hypothetical protein
VHTIENEPFTGAELFTPFIGGVGVKVALVLTFVAVKAFIE